MTRLVVILLLGSLVWMIWWAVGHVAYEKGLNAWIEQRRAEGWAADIATLDTVGFPNRFDTTLTDVRLADPDTGIAWAAPMVQFLSLAYKPHQVIAVLPEQHVFSTPLENLDITHADARASLFLMPSPSLGLDEARFVVKELDIASGRGWDLALEEGRFAAEKLDATENTYRLGALMLKLTPSDADRRLLDPTRLLPETVESLQLDADLSFDAPWDRYAIEDQRPQVTAIDLKDLSAVWGSVNFRAVGTVKVDAQGYPEGVVTVRAVEWRKILGMAVAAGWLPETAADAVESGLELMTGRGDTLDATLNFEDGLIRMGFLPLGPAPQIRIR